MSTIKINSGSGTPASINKPGVPPTVTTNKPFFKSYRLDGVDDYLSIPQTTLNFAHTDPQSYEVWFKMHSLAGVQKTLLSMFGSKGTQIYIDNNQYLTLTIRESSTIRILVRAQFSKILNGVSVNDPKVITGIWYQVIITKLDADANNVNFWVDKEILGKTIQTNNLTVTPPNSANVYLGNSNAVNSPANCEIALVRVFSKELSAEEITTLYNNGQPLLSTSISNKVFEIIPAAILRDSANAVTGTINGATLLDCDVNMLIRNGKQYFTGNNLYYNTFARAGEGDRETISDAPFTDPRHCALYNWETGRHYIGWHQRPFLGGNRQSMLMFVDPVNGFATPSYPMGITTSGGIDNHGAPSLIDPNGEILVIREDQHQSPLYLTRTIGKSFTNIEQLDSIPGSYAYPAPAKLGSDIIIWSRVAYPFQRDQIVRSSDNGNTWTAPTDVFDLNDGVSIQRAYFRRIYHPTKLIFLILRRQENEGLFKQILYIESDDGITYRNITGSYSKNVSTSGFISQPDMQANFNVLTGSTDVWLKTTMLVDDVPVGFCNKDDVDSYYQYFYWNGSTWIVKDLPLPLYEQTQASGNAGRIDGWAMYAYTLNHQILWRIEPRGGFDVIVKYETFDNWDSWDAGTIISAPNKKHEQMQQTYNMDAPSLLILANVIEDENFNNNMFIHKFTP